MSLPEFVKGQRWISNTEPELGLGIILELLNRRVQISFPATGEVRTYAINRAPLSRVQYHTGDKICNQDDQHFTVKLVEDLKGFVIYVCADHAGETVNLPETELKSAIHFTSPVDRLLAGQLDKLSRYKLRYQSLLNWGAWHRSPVRGLLGARVQLLPHQLFIAAEVGQRYAPRVLLADEVGLGKTIEAGLILHQQILTGSVSRVLIVVPESLVHQWLVEMLRRFNLRFSLLNEAQCQQLEATNAGQNPFESAQLVICSLGLLEQQKLRYQQALDASWDLVVVDEAHHLQWSPESASPAYLCIEAIARQCAGLLLLTATPEQLGVDAHFARLRLLDPARYPSLEKFAEEEASYTPLNQLVQKLLDEEGHQHLTDSPALQAELSGYIGEQAVCQIMDELQTRSDPQEVLFGAAKALLDRHGTGRVLFRNTRHAIKGFPQRKLHSWALAAPSLYLEKVPEAAILARLQPETLLGEDWLNLDSRIRWLTEWLKSHRSEKTLVICAQATTAIDLETHLKLRGGVRSAVFHEHLTLIERDRAGAYFADLIEGAQILVCSEIGSEGRNFQFARHLIFFDLPLNPDLLEQRIGRLDRIGQQHDVEIHVPYYEHSAQEALLKWYHQGMDAFERPFAGGQQVYQQFGDALSHCLESCDQATLDQLVAATKAFSDELVAQLKQGRDPLLELNSCHPATASKVIENILHHEKEADLESYMEAVFDQFGVDNDFHSEGTTVLHPSDNMLTSHFPELPDEGMTATYHRDTALHRDDIHFLSWEHPMVTGVTELILEGEFGNTTLCSIKLPPLQAGTILLEAIYVLRCVAPRSLQVERFVSQALVRVLLDSEGNDLSEVVKVGHLDKLGEKVLLRNGQELIRRTRSQLEAMVKAAKDKVIPQQSALIERAVTQMQETQQAEITRLQALAKTNPNIRSEEIEVLRIQTEQLSQAITGATLQPEALRVAIAT